MKNRTIQKLTRALCIFVGALCMTFQAMASDLMEVSPVTNKILMVHIKDGHIDTYGIGQTVSNNITYVNATNLTNATNKSNYLVSSPDDPNYSTAKSPINLGRKSKAVDYNDEWQAIPYIWQHWIYIELPNNLVQGRTYTVQLNNIVENKNSITFVYDVNKLRSETVHVNMVGFSQNSPKYAYLSQWMGDFNTSTHANGGLNLSDKSGAQFRLINYATGATAYSGTISSRVAKTVTETASGDFPGGNYTRADVWQCDFSSFTTPGEYVVAVDGIGCSFPFEISNDITREPFYYAMKGLFWQRQGIVKEIEPGKIMPRDHHPSDITWKWDKNWPGSEANTGFNSSSPRVYGIWGYYHDAGDWDGYVHHAKVPMSLLLLYDLAPDKFFDGEVNNRYKLAETDANWINEGTNGIPDLLDEAVWLINYYKRARTTLQNNYGGTGGVPGYVGRDGVPGNNIPAWQDNREWYLSAENVEQTFLYAGLASWYAICLNKFHQLSGAGNHPDYTSWMNEATAAWNWANGKSITDDNQRRAKGFAAANMYRATANTTYQTAFQDYYNWEPSKSDGEWSNPNLFDVAISIYSLIPSGHGGLNTTLQNTCKQQVLSKADGKVNNINANAFRCGMEYYQFMQLGGFTTPKITLLPVAHKLSGDSKYIDATRNVNNYVLGGNQLNMAYLSGLGERSDVWIFNPNGYLTSDYNSKVYSPEVYIGLTSYFGATGGASGYWFYNSQFSEYFSRTAAYPQAKDFPSNWPGAEQKFHNRYSIQGGEFTVHQQNNYMIYTMGYVKAMANASTSTYSAPTRPTVSLNLTEGQQFAKAGCDLTVTASANVRSVKYYYEWHYIGESFDKANNFKLFWIPPQNNGTSALITAVGYSDKGRITMHTAPGNKNVTISTSATCSQNPIGCTGTGSISYLRYHNISGTAVSNLTSASKYPNSPDFTTTYTSFEGPTNIMDNYGVLMRGYICPPTSGSYTFWIAGDDGVELWLSTNDNPATKTRIAYHNAWTNSKEWNKYATQKSAAIILTAGQNYYVEALMKEGSGGDNIAVGWAKPGQATTSPSEVIPGSSLLPFVAAPATGLTHQWLFNGNANDQIGSANGTLVNTAAYNTTTTKEGTAALDLTATAANGYVNLGTIDLTNTFTISMWAYNQGTRMHQNYLIANSSDYQSNAGFVLWVNDYNSTNGKIVLKHDDGPSDALLTSSSAAFPMNQWNHLALTVENNTRIAKIYVNGTEVASGTIKTIGVNHELWLGQMWSQVWNGWGGYIDDVRTFNTVLSAAEVGSLYNSTKSAVTNTPSTEKSSLSISAYPNPVTDGMLTLRITNYSVPEELDITMIDISGRVVLKKKRLITDEGYETLDCNPLAKGLYFINVQGIGVNNNIKVIIN